MPDINALRKRALHAIDQRRDALFDLSRAIHANPETAYEEREAAARLAELLEKNGFKVQRAYRGVETAYRGDASGKNGGPRVAILAEYDALAELGHGCGHNLIAMIDGRRVGVRGSSHLGSLAAIGTPAEEGGGGKVALLRAGGFDDVDAAMMIHPTTGRSLAGRHSLASNRVLVEYFGKAAHAASQPDQGINALDGLIQLFNSVNAMRQQLRADAPSTHHHERGQRGERYPRPHRRRFSVRALIGAISRNVLRRLARAPMAPRMATGRPSQVTVH